MARRTALSFGTPSRNDQAISRSSRVTGISSAREVLDSIVTPNSAGVRSRSPIRTPVTSHTLNDRNTTSQGDRSGVITPPYVTPNNSSEHASIPSNDFTREFRALRDQQRTLQASSVRIEEMIKSFTSANKENVSTKQSHIPRALSRIVKDVYHQIKEEESLEWNYCASFDDHTNRETTASLIRNVLGVLDSNNHYDHSVIRRAARTYFKSRKSYHQRQASGKQAAAAASSRRRQRRHNKARARLRALNQSQTLDDAMKEKVRPVLTADFMSSEESNAEDLPAEQDPASSDESDQEVSATPKRKTLTKHKVPWRSQELQRIVDSLDRKLDRRRGDRAKAMCLDFTISGDSTRPMPENVPEWAKELFS